ncbi:von Willebrand factor A domain-containing protein 5A-like isoform X2 [Dendropsophus ebraccatus]
MEVKYDDTSTLTEGDATSFLPGGDYSPTISVGDAISTVSEGDYTPTLYDISTLFVEEEMPSFVRLISLQNADGSWNLGPEFSAVLGLSQPNISSKNPHQNMDSVWATVLAVIWLHASCLVQREEWELLEGKAISWLKSKAGSSLDQFVRAGNELLKSSVAPRVFGL